MGTVSARLESIRRFVLSYWQFSLEYTAAMAGILALLLFRLSALTGGKASGLEINTVVQSQSLSNIFENPLYAPYKILVWVAAKIDPNSLIIARLSSVAIALGASCCLFYVLRKWFSDRVAFITTFFFVTSSWFLHVGRLVSPEVILMASIAALAYYLWAINTKRSLLALSLGSALFVGLMYIPGYIWLILPSVFVLRRRILKSLRPVRWLWPVALLAVGVALVPLLMALLKHPSLVRIYFSLPTNEKFIDIPWNLVLIPSRLLWHGPLNPQLWLSNTPLLDYFTAGFAALGGYYYLLNRKLDRSRLVIAGTAAATLLVAFGGAVGLTLLLPFVYLLFASGLAFAFSQWKRVFPYNPFAKGLFATLLVSAAVVVSFYQLSHYFVAWREAPATRKSFNYNLADESNR